MAVSLLKSVIVSSKGGVPIARLNHDYKELVGDDIPVGGQHLQEYLLSIDGITIVDGIVKSTSKSTEHLEKLISQQKDKISKFVPYKRNYGKEKTHPQYHKAEYKERPKSAISGGARSRWIRPPNAAPYYPKSSNNFSENQQRNYHERNIARPRYRDNGYHARQLPPFYDGNQPNWDNKPHNQPPQYNYYNNNRQFKSDYNTNNYHHNNNHNNYNNNHYNINKRFNSNNYQNHYEIFYNDNCNDFYYDKRTCRGNENTNVDYQNFDGSIKRNNYCDENQHADYNVNPNYQFNYNSYKSQYGDYRLGYDNGNSDNNNCNNFNTYNIHYGDNQSYNRNPFAGGNRYAIQTLQIRSHNAYSDKVGSCERLNDFKKRLFINGDEYAKRQRIDSERAEHIRIKRQRLENELAELDRMEREERPESNLAELELAETERLEHESMESKKIERFKRYERERLEIEKKERESAERKQIDRERIESERVERDRIEKERVERERIEKERVERIESERVERERIQSERVVRKQIEKERVELERIESEQVKRKCVGGKQANGRGVSRERIEISDRLEERFVFRKAGPSEESARRKKKPQRAGRQKRLLGIKYTFNDRPQIGDGTLAARRERLADWNDSRSPLAHIQFRSPQRHSSFRRGAPNLNDSGDFPSFR